MLYAPFVLTLSHLRCIVSGLIAHLPMTHAPLKLIDSMIQLFDTSTDSLPTHFCGSIFIPF